MLVLSGLREGIDTAPRRREPERDFDVAMILRSADFFAKRGRGTSGSSIEAEWKRKKGGEGEPVDQLKDPQSDHNFLLRRPRS
jgi:hypothetical protein